MTSRVRGMQPQGGSRAASTAGRVLSPFARKFSRLSWYAQRLRSMSAPEIAHRLHEQTKRKIAQRRTFGWSDFDIGDGPLPALPRPELDGAELDVSLLASWREAAEAVRNSRIELLGQTWPARREPSDWHRDPISGAHWPHDVYCFDVPFRHTRAFGDAKYIWELNRLQYLHPVAALFGATGDAELQDLCLSEIESWMAGSPPFKGLGWATGVECALRVVSLLSVLVFLDHDRIAPGQRRRLRACIAAHHYWLARYPSRFSSANNHLVAEAAGLYLLGALAPDLPRATETGRHARAELIAEATRQIHDDGVGAEQSPTYTCFTIEFYLLCLRVGEQLGEPYPRAVHDRLGLAGEHLRWITDGGGNQPRIGDDDEGRVIASGRGREPGYVSSVLGAMAATCGRADLVPPRSEPHLRDLFFGARGEPAGSSKPPRGVRHFDTGGYTVLRGTIADREVMAVLDHGPLGYLAIAAHGHADVLALWLHLDGAPVLIDAGTYLYHSGKEWRDHFRGTAAHNTLTVNGLDSSRIAGPFNWRDKARAWRVPQAEPREGAVVAAAHDGYLARAGVRHERRLAVDGADRLTVTDCLEGMASEPLDIAIGFLVHPDIEVVHGAANEAVLSRSGETLMTVTPSGDLQLTLERGLADPARGWYSPCFGERVPATRMVWSTRATAGFASTLQLRIARR